LLSRVYFAKLIIRKFHSLPQKKFVLQKMTPQKKIKQINRNPEKDSTRFKRMLFSPAVRVKKNYGIIKLQASAKLLSKASDKKPAASASLVFRIFSIDSGIFQRIRTTRKTQIIVFYHRK